MVQTRSLSKHFHDAKKKCVRAVDEVSVEAAPGKILGLLGVNGAGKTTLLRLLSTVLTPTSGSAEVAGFDIVADSDKVRANIGFMSTTTALYGRLTANEVLAYYGGLYGMTPALLAERTAYVKDKLKLHEFADRLCDKLSTGQKQRVSIARTILHDPPVLFFDEPTTGLDVVTSQTVLEFIEEVRDAGKTVVFSTHIMSEAERLCDHIAVIHEGRIKGEGSLSALLESTGATTLEKAFLALVAAEQEEGNH
jgi:sodium transport system ATP-binding protein